MNQKLSIMESVKTVFLKAYDFKGRARRSELWQWRLMYCLLLLLTYFFYIWSEHSYDNTPLAISFFKPLRLLVLLCIVPNIAVTVRRLHDIGKSGWYLLMPLLPVVGSIVLFVWTITDSQKGDNKWGPSPKYSESGKCVATPSTPLMESMRLFFKNIISVKGRTRSSEFWKPFFFLYFVDSAINIIIWLIYNPITISRVSELPLMFNVLSILSNVLWYFILVTFSIAAVRRLHDMGKDGKMVWMFVAPSLLSFLFQYFHIENFTLFVVTSYTIQILQYSLWAYFFTDSQKAANQWGESSKYPDAQE